MSSGTKDVAAIPRSCSACHKESISPAELKACSVCLSVGYCSMECQKADWTLHKANCTKIATTQLIDAVNSKDKDTVKRLAKTKRILNGKVDYAVKDSNGDTMTLGKWTALHDCVREDNTTMMEILIENGANLEIKDIDGETPVFVASNSRDPALVLMLLRAGANPNAQAKDGWSCLMMAARDGNYEITKGLLEAGADLRGGGDMFGRGALELVNQMRSGQGICMEEGQSFEDALSKYDRVYSLLAEYAARNG